MQFPNRQKMLNANKYLQTRDAFSAIEVTLEKRECLLTICKKKNTIMLM